MSHLKIMSNEADLACIGASAAISTCVCARVYVHVWVHKMIVVYLYA